MTAALLCQVSLAVHRLTKCLPLHGIPDQEPVPLAIIIFVPFRVTDVYRIFLLSLYASFTTIIAVYLVLL
jgi:hypothetical protein